MHQGRGSAWAGASKRRVAAHAASHQFAGHRGVRRTYSQDEETECARHRLPLAVGAHSVWQKDSTSVRPTSERLWSARRRVCTHVVHGTQ